MEKEVRDQIASLSALRREFEVCKLAMALHKERSALTLSFVEGAPLKPKDLLLVYQGEWQPQPHSFCDIHHQPLALYCFLEMLPVCARCVVESHVNHSVVFVQSQQAKE